MLDDAPTPPAGLFDAVERVSDKVLWPEHPIATGAAASRPRDLAVLPELRELLRRQRSPGGHEPPP